MGRLAQIFAFDKRKLWWYRDIALSTVAWIMTSWAIVALTIQNSPFDRRLGMGAAAVAVLCCALTPNRLVLIGIVAGMLAVEGWFAALFTRDPRSYWVAVPATLVAVGIYKYVNRPVIRK
jgi:hypothetical protein